MEKRCWSAGVFTFKQLAARPCHLISLTSSSLVSMTMSRQLPTLRGRRERDLCVPDIPAKDILFLDVPPAVNVVALDTGVKSV